MDERTTALIEDLYVCVEDVETQRWLGDIMWENRELDDEEKAKLVDLQEQYLGYGYER